MAFNAYKTIRLFTWGIGGIALIIFYVWFEYFTPKLSLDANKPVGFNPIIWARSSDDLSDTNPRQAMYLDVVENQLANGLTRFKIEQTLGNPNYIDPDKTYYYLLSYQITDSSFNYLVIHFDSADKVNLFYRTTKRHNLTQ